MYCGPGLAEVCETVGIPPVLHLGSCVDNSRILLAATEVVKAGGLGNDINDLPAAGSAPEWMSEKAISIGQYFVASGVYTIFGVTFPIIEETKFHQLLTAGLEDLGFGKWGFAVDPHDRDCHVQTRANRFWPLEENLPTGKIEDVEGPRDLREPQSLGKVVLDDVLTSISEEPKNDRGHLFMGSVRRSLATVQLHTSQDFREAVVFTPPHRKAFCIEPYTCTTDAINLQQQSIDAGLQVLQPGESWSGKIETSVKLP